MDAIGSGEYGFAVLNFANPDMVRHTRSIPATVSAVETVDEYLGRVVDAVYRKAESSSSRPTTGTRSRCSPGMARHIPHIRQPCSVSHHESRRFTP